MDFNTEKITEIFQRDMNHWNQHGYGLWQWYDKENHRYVGRGGLKIFDLDGKKETELGYAMRPEYWGKEIAVEMSLAALDFAKNVVHLKNICCFTMPRNQQSLRVMQKLGFQYEKDFTHLELQQKLHRLFFNISRSA